MSRNVISRMFFTVRSVRESRHSESLGPYQRFISGMWWHLFDCWQAVHLLAASASASL